MTIKKTVCLCTNGCSATDLVRGQPEGSWRYWVETTWDMWSYRIILGFMFTRWRLCTFYFPLFEFHHASVVFESDTKKTEEIIYNFIKHHDVYALVVNSTACFCFSSQTYSFSVQTRLLSFSIRYLIVSVEKWIFVIKLRFVGMQGDMFGFF